MSSEKILTDFSQDKFKREEIADFLTGFIKSTIPSVNDESLVIGLNSPWGTGKSSFINMWRKKLIDKNEPFDIIFYNAWENDDCPEAIVPIICSFSQLIDERKNDTENIIAEKKKKILTALKKLGPKAVNLITMPLLGFDADEFANSCKELKDSAGNNELKIPELIYEEYSSLQKKKDALRELVESFSSDERKLLIFIDELDRCRPTFAIETLEAVKHFFDLKNVIFVFSLDADQLHKSIKVIYGDIKSAEYLQRFFDYHITLPKPVFINEYIRNSFRTKDDREIPGISILASLTDRWNLSLRDVNVICRAYLNFFESRIKVDADFKVEYKWQKRLMYFIALKYSNPIKYMDEIKNGIEILNQEDKILISIFGYRESTINEYSSIYTKEFAQSNLRTAIGNAKYHYELDELISQNDLNSLNNHVIDDYTVAQSIMNIIDYGQIYPPKISQDGD